MFSFLKNKRNHPEFPRLLDFKQSNQYFIRCAEWDWFDSQNIVAIDPNNPRVLTLDPWPQLIFMAANGQMTVTEYVYFMADKYSNAIPDLLDKTIIDEISSLVDYGIIRLVDKKQLPLPNFEIARSQRQNLTG